MKKKALIITAISILVIVFFSTFSFATSDDGIVGNVVEGAGNMARDAGEMVANVAEDGMDMIDNGAEMIENGVDSQGLNDIGGDAKNATETMTDNGLLSGNQFLGMKVSVWLWIILIIIIIVVIVLICKYMQKHDDQDNDDDEE